MSGVKRGVTPVTTWIDPNEKCWALCEMNLNPSQLTDNGRKYEPESWSGVQRWRIAWVNRGDVLTEYHERSPHPVTVGEVRIPSLWEHDYAELCGLADRYATNRNGFEHDAAFLAERQAESTLIKDFLEEMEDREALVRNRSTFGSLFRKQRNGAPTQLLRAIERRNN